MRLTAPVSLELPNTLAVLRPVRAFVREVLLAQGFGVEEAEELEVALEEAVVNVVEHAYVPGSAATFRVTLVPVSLGIRLVVHDDGLPLDAAALEKDVGVPGSPGLGVGNLLMRRLVDEFSLVNRGRGGKDVEMLKYFRHPPADPGAQRDVVPEKPSGSVEAHRGPTTCTCRLFEPRDALEIARCAWYAYGYSYPNAHVFFPDRMVELNARGELLSLVAVTPEGDLMGHCAAEFPEAGAPSAEIGMAFVKPAYASQGVLKGLTARLLEICRERDLQSVYVQAVTSHVASQRAALASGFIPCALLVGAYPEKLDFKTMGGLFGNRLSLLCALQLLTSLDVPPLFVPPRHGPMVARLYEAFRLRPTFAEVPPSPLPEHGETSVRVEEAINAASVRVRSVGRESVAHLTRVTRDLCLRRVDVIRMALPLEDPGTPELCGAMEEQGYFFAGIFPEGHREHKLLLQYLNNVEWDDQKIQVFGPLTQELLAYVRGCDPHGRS